MWRKRQEGQNTPVTLNTHGFWAFFRWLSSRFLHSFRHKWFLLYQTSLAPLSFFCCPHYFPCFHLFLLLFFSLYLTCCISCVVWSHSWSWRIHVLVTVQEIPILTKYRPHHTCIWLKDSLCEDVTKRENRHVKLKKENQSVSIHQPQNDLWNFYAWGIL